MDQAEEIVIGQQATTVGLNSMDWRLVPRAVPPVLFGVPPVLPDTFKNKNKHKYFQSGLPFIGNDRNADEILYSYRENRSYHPTRDGIMTKVGRRGVDCHVVMTDSGDRIKWCPGNNCHMYLPLFQFGANLNMFDGLDTYCIGCNQRRRNEKGERRHATKSSSSFCIDAYEAFRLKQCKGVFSSESSILTRSVTDNASVFKRDVIRKIDNCLVEARMKQRLDIPFSAESVYDKLFNGKRLHCEVVNSPMTLGCFQDHHNIELYANADRLELKCTNTSAPR